MSASPWLSSTANHSPNASSQHVANPWTTTDSEYLDPNAWSSSSQQQLRSRKSSPALQVSTSNSQPVDRHPLRSPSPASSLAGPSSSGRPDATRRPSAVASEWKAISAGLAGLFGGASSSSSSSSYKWPADPATSTLSTRTSRQSASHSGTVTPVRYGDDDNDEARKGRPLHTVESTLDRLEDWFGLRQQQQQQQQQQQTASSSSIGTTPNRSRTSSSAANKGNSEQVRVLIHPVAPTDTLSSLALHYGADMHILRKSNKLWPGDPVQIRKVIYIPVDSCKHRPPNAEIKILPSTGGVVSSDNTPTLAFVPKTEDEDLLTGTPNAEIPQPNMRAESLAPTRVSDPVIHFMPDTNKAYTDSTPAFGTSLTRAGSINGAKQPYPPSLTPALRSLNQNQSSSHASRRATSSRGGGSNTPSITASVSAASSGFVPPRQPLHVAKVPADQLRYFANDSNSSTPASQSKKSGPGDADFRPGESGIDDLLALAANAPSSDTVSGPVAPSVPRPNLTRNRSNSNVSDMNDEDDEWKPNTWHFGASSSHTQSKTRGATSDGFASNRSGTMFDGDDAEASHYSGWNDAPPANAVVAKAYDGGKAYQRRQAQKSHRLLYDLAAGLPANSGAASKWARPIQFGDSLPAGPPTANVGSTAAGGATLGKKSHTKGGFGKLLDDTIRGRISVEAALEGALKGVRAKASPLPQSTPPRRPNASQNSGQPPPRQPPSGDLLPPPPRHSAPVADIHPLSSSDSVLGVPSSRRGLEQRRPRSRVDWSKDKDD